MSKCFIAILVLSMALGGMIVAYFVVDTRHNSYVDELERQYGILRGQLEDAQGRVTVLRGRSHALEGLNRELVGQNRELGERVIELEAIIDESRGITGEAGESIGEILAAARRAIQYLDEYERAVEEE